MTAFGKFNRTAIIAVLYDFENALITVGKLDVFASFSGIDEKIAVINNTSAYSKITGSLPIGWSSIEGSNFAHEFSGYQEGINCLRYDIKDYEAIVFANDTVGRPGGHLGTDHLVRLQTFKRKRRKPYICGDIHYASAENSEMSICSNRASPWVSTGLFVLSGSALAVINGQVNYIKNIQHLIEDSSSSPEIFTQLADSKLVRHISAWLCDGYRGGWNKAPTLDADAKLSVLRAKAKMILCEKYLSITLRNHYISFHQLGSAKVSFWKYLPANLRHLFVIVKNLGV